MIVGGLLQTHYARELGLPAVRIELTDKSLSYACLLYTSNDRVTVLGFDIHGLFRYAAVVDDIMAPMFDIHITQGQNLVSLQAAPHTGYIRCV